MLVLVGALGWTVRDNITGRETGTGEANVERRRVDRFANAFVPVVLSHLLAGAYETVAITVGLPTLTDRGMAGASHLLAAGGGALLVFTVGFRLFPRFLVSSPPSALVAIALPAGAVGPALVAGNPWGNTWFQIGGIVEGVAMVGFAFAYVALYYRSDRRRIGLYGPPFGAVAGVAGVALGVYFAFVGVPHGGSIAHYRLNVLGFLGLTIVGVAYQFYPPAVGTFSGGGNRTALASMYCPASGVGTETFALLAHQSLVAVIGRLLALVGACLYVYHLLSLFRERYGGR